MPIDLRQVAAISGQSGLYKIVKPTRTGVIVQSLEDTPKTMVAQARHRMSILDEISIYTTDEEGTVPLAEVFEIINEKYGDKLPLSDKPSDDEYKEFMSSILPDFDEDRVYVSDMKKLASWYAIVSKHIGFNESESEAPAEEAAETEKKEKKEKPAKAAAKPKKTKTEKK